MALSLSTLQATPLATLPNSGSEDHQFGLDDKSFEAVDLTGFVLSRPDLLNFLPSLENLSNLLLKVSATSTFRPLFLDWEIGLDCGSSLALSLLPLRCNFLAMIQILSRL